MRVVDISDLASPRKVGLVNTPGYAEGIVIVNDRAYIGDGESGLRVADISVPKSPKETALNDTPGYAFDVHVAGNLAFVADGKAGLRILDDSGHSVLSCVHSGKIHYFWRGFPLILQNHG